MLSILVTIVVFTLLSTFLFSWFNYRYKSLNDNLEATYDWCRDNEISVIFDSGLKDKLQVSSSYFDLAVNLIYSLADETAPGMFDSYTASMSCSLDSLHYAPQIETFSVTFITLQQDVYNFLADCLILGRLPSNKTELLYFSHNSSNPIYDLGDKVGLQVVKYDTSYVQNFTIVGILDDFSYDFYQRGYSN